MLPYGPTLALLAQRDIKLMPLLIDLLQSRGYPNSAHNGAADTGARADALPYGEREQVAHAELALSCRCPYSLRDEAAPPSVCPRTQLMLPELLPGSSPTCTCT